VPPVSPCEKVVPEVSVTEAALRPRGVIDAVHEVGREGDRCTTFFVRPLVNIRTINEEDIAARLIYCDPQKF